MAMEVPAQFLSRIAASGPVLKPGWELFPALGALLKRELKKNLGLWKLEFAAQQG